MKEDAFEYIDDQQIAQRERYEEGICIDCGKRPINPQVDSRRCLECFEDTPMCCSHDGCANRGVGEFGKGSLCEKHLVTRIHKMMESYLKMRSRLHDLQQEYNDLLSDPNVEDNATRVINVKAERREVAHQVHQLDDSIQRYSAKINGDVWHENYNL